MLHRLARVWPARTGRWVLVLLAACSLGVAGNASAQPAAQVEKAEVGACVPNTGGAEVPCVDSENPGVFSQDELDGLAALDSALTGVIDRADCLGAQCDVSLECGDTVRSVLTMENQGSSASEAFFIVQAWDIINPDDPGEFVIPNGGTDVLPEDLPGGTTAPGGCDSSNPSVPADCAGVDHLPIAAASGNTNCDDSPDLPCVLCPGGADATTNPECTSPFDGPGRIVFLSNEYVAQDADAGILGNRAGTNRYAKCDGLGGCDTTIPAELEDVGTRPVECPNGQLQNYKCYSAKPEPGTGFVQKEVELTDQFDGTTVATVITPFEICNPVRKEGLESDSDDALNGPGEPHLMCYKLLAADTIGPDVLARLTDQFGSLTHRIGDSVVLCQPALKSCFDRAVEDAIEAGATPEEAEGIAELLCAEAYEGLDAKLAHFNCYQSFEQAEQPFGQCSDTVQVCDVDADCPGFDPAGGGETCVPLSPPVPYLRPAELELTDQWGTTLSTIGETSLHCNPITEKAVNGGTPELFDPPLFPTDASFPNGVPDGVNIAEEEVHYRCYLIDDDGPPDLLEDDPLNRRILVQDQFGTNPIRVGIGTRLCEPAVKELLEEKPAKKACGLFGIEALLGLVPLALLRRRKERRH